jgi:hypothetical protein
MLQSNFITLNNGQKTLVGIEEQFNFSVKKVESDKIIEVSIDHQMFVNGTIQVLGQLNVFGEIVYLDLEDADNQQVIPPADPENFSHFKVITGETKIVPLWQQMNVYGQLNVDGQLNVLGEVNLAQIHQEQPDPEQFTHEENFSYKKILTNTMVKVRTNEQMVTVGNIEVLGQLTLNGELALISAEVETDLEDDFLPPYKIESGESFKIGNNRLMFLPRSLINLGTLNVYGELVLGGL